ncbi:MAG TPA: sugar transferase [bacterium]|nr:sugar transferase [bacterium]HOH06470.1 sugar transferase [bacterium]
MGTTRKKLLAKGTRILDLTVMLCSLSGAVLLHAQLSMVRGVSQFTPALLRPVDGLALILLLIAWNRLFAHFGLYTVRRLDERVREWLDIAKAVSLGTLVAAALTLLVAEELDNKFILLFYALALFASISSRALVREGLVFLRSRGRNLRHIVFVGSGPEAVDLSQKILHRADLGYRLLGFVDDHPQNTRLWQGKWLCTLDAFPDYLCRHAVDEVFIALPISTCYEQVRRITCFCDELSIPCRVPSDWMELKTADTPAYELNGVPMLTLRNAGRGRFSHLVIKRLLDVTLAGAGLLLLAPLFLVVSALIALSSSGPVFFKQQRVGFNRRRFRIYKFRTMVDGAEALQAQLEHLNEADGAAFKIAADPRITPVGRWLRRTSIDEIPQLINVLKGEMSLVGPRPLPVRDVNNIYEQWPIRRFSMRPGLTCLWQISGRHRLRFNEWMRLDLKYIDEWSIWLDLKIMLRTIPEVVRATGE